MSHHSASPLSRAMHEQFGPTGEYPRGKLTASDEGEIMVGIAHDQESKTVIIDFGTPVRWIGFTGEQANEIAATLIKHANALRGIT